MYKIINKKGKFYIQDPSNKNLPVAYSKSKRKAEKYSAQLLVRGFEGHIPGFLFAGNPINLDVKPQETDNIYS